MGYGPQGWGDCTAGAALFLPTAPCLPHPIRPFGPPSPASWGRTRPAGLLGALIALAAAALAPPAAGAFTFPGTVKLAPECVSRVNRAALEAMNRTSPLGQMQIFGDPAVFDPHLVRVTVNVYGARTEIYAVDLVIDDACRVISASTRLESNDWPYR